MYREMKRGCSPKEGLKKGAWTIQEDKLLSDYIKAHGLGRWRSLPANAGLNRCGKSCRLRWLNYLRPDIKRGNITEEEEELIVRLHKLLGNRWSLIAGRLPGRTDNEIKNYLNTYLRKKAMGEISEQPSSSMRKKVSPEKPCTEYKEKSDVNVIRTKAVRCTRPLFTDQLPTLVVNNSSDGPIPNIPLDSDFLWGFNRQCAYPSLNINDNWMAEFMQNSHFPLESKDNSHTCSHSLNDIDDAKISFSNDIYIRGLLNGGIQEGEGLSSFLDADSWDSMFMSQRT